MYHFDVEVITLNKRKIHEKTIYSYDIRIDSYGVMQEEFY
jgi:hypothetical protein